MKTKRIYIPGSEWLFYKIYSGPKTLEQILLSDIFPVIKKLLKEGSVKSFFFLRYNDPEYHLRLRLYIPDPGNLSHILHGFKTILEPYIQEKIISKITLDCYNREIERYGRNTIQEAETLFFFNSETVLHIINYCNENDLNSRWLWGIKYADMLLDKFNFTIEDKISFFKHLSDGYLLEFNTTNDAKRSLDAKFRKYKSAIQEIMDLKDDTDHLFKALSDGIRNSDNVITKILRSKDSGMLEVELSDFLGGLIHMHYNRLFNSQQRTYELVIYYMSHKAYVSALARRKYSKN